MDIHQLNYLESTANLKIAVQQSQMWRPSTAQAHEICACLRQARLFLNSASQAPLEIRPLELYYGVAAYAKALVLSTKRNTRLSTLAQSHGVKDTSSSDSRLESLRGKIEGRGTFVEFNDFVAPRNQIRFDRADRSAFTQAIPTASSANLAGLSMTMLDLLGRIPNLGELFYATTGRGPLARRAWFDIIQEAHPPTINVEIQEKFRTFDQFVQLATLLREEHPILRHWAISRAYLGGTSHSAISFADLPPDSNEYSPDHWKFHTNMFEYKQEISVQSGLRAAVRIDGGLAATRQRDYYLVSPLEGNSIHSHSLQFLALHLLSSLARYRPSVWMHALSRTAIAERPADDHLLALLEKFLMWAPSNFQTLVCETLLSSNERI